MPTWVEKQRGMKPWPSARMAAVVGRPIRWAVSRDERKSLTMPRSIRTAGRAGWPSSSKAKEPRAPGVVGSATTVTASEPYRILPRSSARMKEVPANPASSPKIRSSSNACPHDSWIWSAVIAGPSTRSAVPATMVGARSSARASSATRGSSAGSPSSSRYSQPAAAVFPWKELG